MTVSQKAEGRGRKAEGRRQPARSRLPAYCLRPAAFWHWALPTILLVYLLLGLLWSLVVPLGEGPDEPAHFQYALFLKEERRLPVQSTDPSRSDLPGEGHQPPLAYLLMQPFIGVSSSEEGRLELYGNPRFRWNGGDQLNAYLHGARERPPYQGAFLAWHLARLLSVALGAASVAVCYATIRRLWPELPSLALGGAALVAFNPQWIFHHALVSNDPLLIALSSALIYASVVAAEGQWSVASGQLPVVSGQGPTGKANSSPYSPTTDHRLPSTDVSPWRFPLYCGALLGLMLLTKQSAIALLPVPLLGLFLGRRRRPSWLVQGVVLLVVSLLIGGWWYVRNWLLYGDPFGLQVFQESFGGGDFQLGNWQSWRAGGWNLLRSSWGLFGWMTLPLPDVVYTLVSAALVVAAAGLFFSAGSGRWRGRGRAATILLVSVGLVWLWLVLFAQTTGTVGWPGRYLFPAAPALATLLAAGLGYALPWRSGLWTITALCLLLAGSLPFTLIRPAYSSPALAEGDVPKGAIYARFDPGWKRGIELRDASFPRMAQPGTVVPVALTWHLVEQTDRSWSVFLHLVDPAETIVAERNAPPLEGRLPTNAWVPGDWFRDEQLLALTNVPPGIYHLRIGLFDPVTGERLAVYDQEGNMQGDFVDLGELQVVATGD